VEVFGADGAGEGEEVVDALVADVGGEVAGDEPWRHAGGGGDAAFEDRREEGGDAEDAAGDADHEAGGVALEGAEVGGGDRPRGEAVDQDEAGDAFAAEGREAEGDGAAQVDADDDGAGDAEGGQGAVEVVGLGGDPEFGVEGAVGLAVAQEVEGDRRVLGAGDLGGDRPPEEAVGAEPMEEDDGGPAVAVALDMDRAGADGDAEQIRFDATLGEIALSGYDDR
jgi:hypothetical protein